MDRILVLSAAYVPLGLVPWTRAVSLLWQAKAEVVEDGERVVCSPSIELRLPAVLRLVHMVPFRRPRVRLNRRNVLRRDDFTCQYCGRRLPASELNLDHVIPKSRGGATRWDNLVTACIRDNTRKGSRTPEEAGLRLLRRPERPRWGLAEWIRRTHPALPAAWETYLPRPRRSA